MWIVRVWVPIAVAVTLLSGVMYVAIQQMYRQALNDPQIQLAEDAARLMQGGATPADIVPRTGRVDIAASLAPWIAVYDAKGTPLEADAMLDSQPPQPPVALFNTESWDRGKTYQNGMETRVTWQPRVGVRQAIVIVQAGDRFVVVGRNMRESEARIAQLGTILLMGWIATLLAALVVVWIGSFARHHIAIMRD